MIIEYGRGAADRYDNATPADLLAVLEDVNYRLFDLAGRGPYTLAQLEDAFAAGFPWNFLLHP